VVPAFQAVHFCRINVAPDSLRWRGFNLPLTCALRSVHLPFLAFVFRADAGKITVFYTDDGCFA
jgi:hypothetical protein